MIEVSIIGSGNIAQHLIAAFSGAPSVKLVQVLARHPEKVAHLVDLQHVVTAASDLQPADVYLIAVSDTAIGEVANSLPFADRLVAHTAGSLPISLLGTRNRNASFYPLQTFSKSRPVKWKDIPVCVEADHEGDLDMLRKLAATISDHVETINGTQRLALHTAAVFVCNFVNHLYACGEDICRDNHLNFNLLKPLIAETASKVMTLSPDDAQTGPARRGDQITIDRHLTFLNDNQMTEIYTLLTASIKQRHEL